MMQAREEAAKILELVDGKAFAAMKVIEEQLNVLHARSQVMVSLAGVVVTVTGFSGRIIAGTCPAAQGALISGLALTLASAIWVFTRCMSIKWLTSEFEGDTAQALETAINRRNRKTRSYRTGGIILGLGLALYGVAVAIMLANPDAPSLSAR